MSQIALKTVDLPEPPEVEKHRWTLFPWSGHHSSVESGPLIPEADCLVLQNWLVSKLEPMKRQYAPRLTALILGGFTEQRVNDPNAFAWHLTELFAEYPAWAGAEVVKEYPRAYKWIDVATIAEMLEQKVKKIRHAHYHIAAQIKEHPKRRERAEQERLLEQEREEWQRQQAAEAGGHHAR